MSGTSALRGRDQETFRAIDLTGSVGRSLTMDEAQNKILRFTGTLGQSVTLRLPLSVTENPGYTGTFENATLGGFTLTISPPSGSGAAVAPGTAVTAFYDGAAMVAQASSAATGISASVGGISTLYPIIITDPQIGDAVTFTDAGGGAFVNVPSGAATMAIGSDVASGTVGSVLFIDAFGLAQDNTHFFWDTGNVALGLGTNALDASAQLQGVSTAKGWAPPRWTTTQRNAIASPLESLFGYNLTTHRPEVYNGTAWGTFSPVAMGDTFTSATAGSVFFAGTAGILAQDNANLFWDDGNNRLGIGNNAPTVALDVTGSERLSGTLTLTPMTAGSVLFAGTAGLVSQDNANLFWNDTTNRLGIGINAPLYRLHVKDAASLSSVTFELGDGAQTAALRLYPATPASGGATTIGTGGFIGRAFYWNGAASVPVDGWVRTHVETTVPDYFLAFGVNASDRMWIRDDGHIFLGQTIVPIRTGGPITQGVVISDTLWLQDDVTMNAGVNFTMTGGGTQWGTSPTEKQGWFGATPVVQQASPTGTDSQKITGIITALETYGLLGL